MSRVVSLYPGNLPLILAMPHSGTYVPEDILEKFNERGRALADTDWHLPRLYDGLLDDVTIIKANFHRYVIDPNRPPDGQSLYPGQNTTGLCPLKDFEGKPIYKSGQEPDAEEIGFRQRFFHQPYHDLIEQELARLCKQHGYAILYDCHSIRSEIDFLFDGVLPDLNIGTFDNRSCDDRLTNAVMKQCQMQSRYSYILNGRFKGGWTTRYYGGPSKNIHAIQMELCQSTYMDEYAPWTYRPEKAQAIRQTLNDLLRAIIETDLS